MDAQPQGRPQGLVERRTPRRYAFACRRCKEKKTRCDGNRPECGPCSRAGIDCLYQSKHNDRELERAHERIRDLEHRVSQLSRISGHPEDEPTKTTRPEGLRYSTESASQDAESILEDTAWSTTGLADNHVDFISRFHTMEESLDRPRSFESTDHFNHRIQSEHLPVLRRNLELLDTFWQPLVMSKSEHDLGLPPALAWRLLDYYWTWQHPVHGCIYKPSFMMDLALGGPSCSSLLLFSMYALAARHVTPDCSDYHTINKGEPYLAKAKTLLLAELNESKTKISTIQAVLTMSGRQCAVGKTSEGWAYLGMALHLLTDAGLHFDLKKQGLEDTLTPAEMEQRRRLCMAAFTFDKTLCLCLGRPPLITRLPKTLEDVLDDLEDEELWSPSAFPAYPAARCHTTACCRQFYKLCKIVPMVFYDLSSAGKNGSAQTRTTALQQRLQAWHDGLPDSLRISEAKELQACPPLHILSLNLLYHTLRILAWRSSIKSTAPQALRDKAMRECVEQAEIMHHMFVLCGTTFDWSNTTYLVTYCVYTAATVDIVEIASRCAEARARASARLGVALRLLEGEVKQTPGVRSSIDILKHRLAANELVIGSDTAVGTPMSPAPHSIDANKAGAASNPGTPAVEATSAEDITMPATPPQSSRPEMAHGPELSGQMVQEPLSEMWNMSLMDMGAGFQPDSFAWDMDESLMAWQ